MKQPNLFTWPTPALVTVIILLCVGWALSAGPVNPFRSPKANAAKVEHDAAVKKAKAEYDKAVKAAGEKYAGVLHVCQTECAQANDLDGALKYKDAKEAAMEGTGSPSLDGVWFVDYSNGVCRIMVIGGGKVVHGTVVKESITRGSLAERNGKTVVDAKDGRLDVVAMQGAKLSVTHYSPASDFALGKVCARGNGTRITPMP